MRGGKCQRAHCKERALSFNRRLGIQVCALHLDEGNHRSLETPNPVELPKLTCHKCSHRHGYPKGRWVIHKMNQSPGIDCDCGARVQVLYQQPEGTTGLSEAKEEKKG